MKLSEAIKGYILDAKIAPQSQRHILMKEQVLGRRLLSWCESQGANELSDVTTLVLKGFAVHLQQSTISQKDTRVTKRGKKLSPTTVYDYMGVVRAFFSWCDQEGYLEGRPNPAKRVPRIKVPEYLLSVFTPEQMEAMLDSCDLTTTLGFRDYTILLVFMDTGIRVSELVTLKLADVHEDYLTVFGKFSKQREVGLSPATARALWKYIHQFRKVNENDMQRVFPGKFGGQLDRHTVWLLLRRAGDAAGVTGVRVSPHTLRHSFAKMYLVNGGELIKLSRALGHSSVRTTEIYLKDLQSREARADHTKFSPVSTHKLGRRSGKRDKDDTLK